MDTTIAEQRIFTLKEKLSKAEAEQIAWKKKIDAFGTVNKVASFLSRPKDEDFELIYSEHRFQPVLYVKAESRYVYDRTTAYLLPASGSEVQKIDLLGKEFDVDAGQISLTAVDHCVQEEESEVVVDAITGEKSKDLKKYLSFSATEVSSSKVEKLGDKDTIMVPPQIRASAIVRELLTSMMKVIQADKIFEEQISITSVDLYYRPVYAFQFQWSSKNKQAIVEVDALTGEVSFGRNVFKEYLGKALDKEFLFDIGGEAAGMIVPGGNIAVKLARHVIDTRKK